jgi:voltage-gated potassium channel
VKSKNALTGTRLKVYEIIFEADTRAGKTFDIVLLSCILASVVIIILESVPAVRDRFGEELRIVEWFFTGIFTIEYAARVWTVPNKRKYIFSFLGIIDVLSILPTYIAFFFPGAQSLMVIRSLRLLRIS